MSMRPCSIRRALILVGAWTAVVGFYPLLYPWLAGDTGYWAWMAKTWPYNVYGALAVAIPFTSMAAGMAMAGCERRRPWIWVGIGVLVAVGFFLIGAYVGPLLNYHYSELDPERLALAQPWGPWTPGRLLRLKAHILANPVPSYFPERGNPFRWPPSWIDFVIHGWAVTGVLVVVNGLLGWAVAERTLRFGRRWARWAVWATAMATAIGYISLWTWVAKQVRAHPFGPGGLAAWVPLAVVCIVLALVWPRAPRGKGEDKA